MCFQVGDIFVHLPPYRRPFRLPWAMGSGQTYHDVSPQLITRRNGLAVSNPEVLGSQRNGPLTARRVFNQESPRNNPANHYIMIRFSKILRPYQSVSTQISDNSDNPV
jgi:hypothetical protein